MSKIAIMFPGQGSQKVGMAEDLYQTDINATSILDRANESLSFDLLDVMFKDSEGILGLTEYTQPALLTHSTALMNTLKDIKYDYALGHSLGEYSALVSEGVLKFEDAVQIVHKRGLLMSEAFPQGVGSMAAVLGLNIDEVREICGKLSTEDEIIEPANINCPGQIVVSGHTTLIEKLVSEDKSLGAKRVMPLKVSGPFHSSMMKTIAADFKAYIDQFEWHDAEHPIVQNVHAKPETDHNVIKENMVKQLFSPVEYSQSIEYLIADGVDHFIEIGPNKVLSGLVKKISRDVKITSIQTIDDVKGWNE